MILCERPRRLGVQVSCGENSAWSDPQRHLHYADYLSLFPFGLLNPVVKTMRALCQA